MAFNMNQFKILSSEEKLIEVEPIQVPALSLFHSLN